MPAKSPPSTVDRSRPQRTEVGELDQPPEECQEQLSNHTEGDTKGTAREERASKRGTSHLLPLEDRSFPCVWAQGPNTDETPPPPAASFAALSAGNGTAPPVSTATSRSVSSFEDEVVNQLMYVWRLCVCVLSVLCLSACLCVCLFLFVPI